MIPRIIKATYSPSLRLRYQFYEDGTMVGFANSCQTQTEAKERVMHHVHNGVNPCLFAIETPEEAQIAIDSVNDWLTIYEAQ